MQIGTTPMPAPNDFIGKISKELATALIPLLHELWDRCEAETREKVASDLVRGITSGRVFAMATSRPAPTPAPQAGLGLPDPVQPIPMSPQKRGAQNREAKGVVKGTIRAIIYEHPRGVSRAQIRALAAVERKLNIKPGSMKQGLRLLREENEIENRDGKWFPTKTAAQSDD